MAIQENVGTTIAYGVESTLGTPSVAAGKYIRRVSSSLVLGKDSFQSNEVRPDQQISDMRHGTRRPAGNIEGELSTQTWDDWIEALMRGTWTVGITASNTDFTSCAADNSTKKFTIAGGSWITKGFKVGDVIRFTNMSATTNNGVNFTITALTATDATVYPAPTTQSADTSFNVAVVGSKLQMGTVKRSFTIEQTMPSLDISEQFVGCRIGGGNFSLSPQGMATVSWDVQGTDGSYLSGVSSPYFVSPTAAPNTGIMAGPNGFLSVNGTASAVVTGFDFNINLGLSSNPVVGSNKVPDIFYGRSVVTGNLSAYIEDITWLNYFNNETEIDVIAFLEDVSASPSEFLCFRFNRVKLSSISKQLAAEGGTMAQFQFQALLKTGGAGTAYDQSSCVIQRSN